MRFPSLRHWPLLLAVVFCVAVRTDSVEAQAQNIQEAAIDLPVGTLFEIAAQTNVDSPEYSWVLTKDREFLQAGRSPLFRVRLVEPGAYQLTAGITGGDETIMRIIPISVRPRTSLDAPLILENPLLIVDTIPASDEAGRVGFVTGRSIVRITPLRTDVTEWKLDMDPETDSDGDGEAENDQDVAGSFFSMQGTPIHIWFTEDPTARSFIVQAVTSDGETLTQGFTTKTGEDDASGIVRGTMVIEPLDDGTIAFSIDPKVLIPLGDDLLLQWEFGDGKQSLLDRPIHGYALEGTYVVSASVRSLETGKILKQFEETYVVTTPLPAGTGSVIDAGSSSSALSGGDTGSSPTEPDGNDTAGTDDGSSFMSAQNLYFLLRVGLVLFLSIAAGGLGIWILSKFKGGTSLEKAVEEAEKRLVATSKTPSVLDAPPPMALPDTPDESTAESTHEPFDPRAAEPSVDMKQAPGWLTGGLTKAQAKGEGVFTPPSATIAQEPTPAPSESMPVSTPEYPAAIVPTEPAPQPIKEPSTPRPQPASEPSSPPLDTTPHEPIQADTAPAWLMQGLEKAATPPQEPEPQMAEPTPEQIDETLPPVESLPAMEEPTPEPPAPTTVPPAPEPIAPTKMPEVAAPEPAPTPVEPVAPVPVAPTTPVLQPTPTPEPDLSSGLSSVASAKEEALAKEEPQPTAPFSPAEQARMERERERKRLKRQRYRANKKMREDVAQPVVAQGETATQPSVTPSVAPPSTPVQNLTPDVPSTEPVAQEMDENEPIAFVQVDSISPASTTAPQPSTEPQKDIQPL